MTATVGGMLLCMPGGASTITYESSDSVVSIAIVRCASRPSIQARFRNSTVAQSSPSALSRVGARRRGGRRLEPARNCNMIAPSLPLPATVRAPSWIAPHLVDRIHLEAHLCRSCRRIRRRVSAARAAPNRATAYIGRMAGHERMRLDVEREFGRCSRSPRRRGRSRRQCCNTSHRLPPWETATRSIGVAISAVFAFGDRTLASEKCWIGPSGDAKIDGVSPTCTRYHDESPTSRCDRERQRRPDRAPGPNPQESRAETGNSLGAVAWLQIFGHRLGRRRRACSSIARTRAGALSRNSSMIRASGKLLQ